MNDVYKGVHVFYIVFGIDVSPKELPLKFEPLLYMLSIFEKQKELIGITDSPKSGA